MYEAFDKLSYVCYKSILRLQKFYKFFKVLLEFIIKKRTEKKTGRVYRLKYCLELVKKANN